MSTDDVRSSDAQSSEIRFRRAKMEKCESETRRLSSRGHNAGADNISGDAGDSDVGDSLDFVALAAHDLRMPLAVISSAAQALQMQIKDSDSTEQKQCLESILRNTKLMESVTRDLIDTVQFSRGSVELCWEPLDLTHLTRSIVHDFQETTHTHPLRFEGDRECFVMGDRERLQRIVFNLVSNALKYSESGREICVEVWQRGANVCLVVQDSGQGIATGEAERLFLPFTRLDRTSAVADGYGLGLASVKQIADAHGATICVQDSPHHGTTFEVCFKGHYPGTDNA